MRNRSVEAKAFAFVLGFQPLQAVYNPRNPGTTAIGRMFRTRSVTFFSGLAIVQRIFRLAVEGHSPFKIGTLLRADYILTPRAYLAEPHQRYLKVANTRHPYDWGATTERRVRLNSRESELQTIQKKLYEDNALGKITDEQYTRFYSSASSTEGAAQAAGRTA